MKELIPMDDIRLPTKEKICGIYKITNKLNGKCYIGQSKDILFRLKNHLHYPFSSNINVSERDLYKDLRKFGTDNFEFEILERCKPEELNEKEKAWISEYDSFNSGYNSTNGGGGKNDKKIIVKPYYCCECGTPMSEDTTFCLNCYLMSPLSKVTCCDSKMIADFCNRKHKNIVDKIRSITKNKWISEEFRTNNYFKTEDGTYNVTLDGLTMLIGSYSSTKLSHVKEKFIKLYFCE